MKLLTGNSIINVCLISVFTYFIRSLHEHYLIIIILLLIGFCIKCWKDSGEKLFINICHTEFIPRPEDITDSEIHKLMANCYEGNIDDNSTELENSKFFIPMSIGKLHTESDKGKIHFPSCFTHILFELF